MVRHSTQSSEEMEILKNQSGRLSSRRSRSNISQGSYFTISISWFGMWILILIAICPGVLAQQQSFRRRPEDVDVKLGDTAILRCEIENQGGQAQWTKDGFALGFRKEIPGFAGRYSMVGETERGIHNLRIANVTLMDIAEYQCQVGPGNRTRAIRSDAHLNVLVPPKSVEITNHANDATIILKENVQTELECVVKEARPAASIIWYMNDVLYRTESREDTTEEVEVLENDLRIKKNTTRSKIKFTPIPGDDFSKFACEARHSAVSNQLRVTVNIRVQYPPGAPRIDGYNEGDPIRENHSITLICISRGGNPLAELIWYKDNIRIDSSYATQGRDSRNELTFTTSTKDNLARFRCEATNMMSLVPKIADVVLTVMFPPKEVKITGPSEAKINETLTLICLTSNSNPKSDVVWFKGGSPLESAYTSSTLSIDGGWVTFSNVTIKIEETDRKMTFTCQAINRGLGDTKSVNQVIHVIQPPGIPIIYKETLNITVGQVLRIACTSTGGHPAATMIWYRAGKKIDSTTSVDGNTVKAELSLEANVTDNGVQYKCEAKNKATVTPLSTSITFSVLFPPSGVTISIRPKKLKEGEKAFIICESGSSNPPARVSFHKDLQLVSSNLNQTIKDGKNGGKKTSITMELDLNSSFDKVMYTCEAKNSAVSRSVHDTITLDVNYKPKFVEAIVKVTVIEGESTTINLKAKGNPDLIKYKWMRNNSIIKTSNQKWINGSFLNITQVNRTDKGKYECEGSNSEGATIVSVELDVKYSPTITTPKSSILVGHSEDAQLECFIDANPLDESMVSWKYNNLDITRPTQKGFTIDKKSYITILNVNVGDAGDYSCIVNNGIGLVVNNSVFLIVKHKPKIDASPQIAKSASNKGEIGKLICRAKGAPNVSFSWSREGVIITNSLPAGKYEILNRMIDPITFESTLLIKNVQTEDYGNYECIARNELDIDQHIIKLNITSPPDPPLGLHIVSFTHDSVTLKWLPGFDGGFVQSYRILYMKVSSDHKRYIDVTENGVTTFTVSPLALGTEYSFFIMAFNSMGESNWTTETVRQETNKVGSHSISISPSDYYNPLSKLVMSAFIILGTTMLIINILLIACFIKRRTRIKKRLNSEADLPKSIIITVIVIGIGLILVNIFIVSFLIMKKRKNKEKEKDASDQVSTKSATMEMYEPITSYTETLTGETISSISEKSHYSQNGSGNHDEYMENKGLGVSTYFIENNQEFPYAGRSTTLPRNRLTTHLEDDGYIESLRNLYNHNHAHGAGDKSIYGHQTYPSPPQIPPIPELFNIPPEARYVPYPPSGFGNSNDVIRHPFVLSNSQDMLNNYIRGDFHSQSNRNGRIIDQFSPQKSNLRTFAPSSVNMEHEGHLV